jgi:hypothetical protein
MMVPTDGQRLLLMKGGALVVVFSLGNETISWILDMAIEPFSMWAKDCQRHDGQFDMTGEWEDQSLPNTDWRASGRAQSCLITQDPACTGMHVRSGIIATLQKLDADREGSIDFRSLTVADTSPIASAPEMRVSTVLL